MAGRSYISPLALSAYLCGRSGVSPGRPPGRPRQAGSPSVLSAGGDVVKFIPSRRLVWTLLTVTATVACFSSALVGQSTAPPAAPAPAVPAPAPAGPLRYSRNVPGDSKPLSLMADQAVTWLEKGQRIILLQGQVMVQQGTVRLWGDSVALFVNLDRLQRTGILHADLYAEGNVRLEDAKGLRKGPEAVLDLNTRGEMRIQSVKQRGVQQPFPEAPLFRKAVAALSGGTGPTTGHEEAAEPARRSGPTVPPAVPDPSPPPPPGPPSPLGPPVPVSPTGPPPTPGPPAAVGPPEVPAPKPPAGPRALAPSDVVPVQFTPGPPPSPPPPPNPVPVPPSPVPTPKPTPPPAPRPPATPGAAAPGGRLLAPPQTSGVDRQYTLVPRTSAGFQINNRRLPSGEDATIVTGGVLIGVRAADGSGILDIEADNAVVWSRGGLTPDAVDNMRSPGGQTSRELEFYLSGNVQVRSQSEDLS